MKRLFTLLGILVLALLVVVPGEQVLANTFAHNVRITQPTSEDPFDGRFNDGSGAAIRFVLADRADSVVINIKLGVTLVRTLRAPAFVSGDTLMIWDGNNNNGQPVSSGDYNVEITAYDQGYGAYTQLFYEQPAVFTRGVTAVRNQSARSFGFIYSADGAGGYVNNGIARHSADGRQWGDVEGNARLTSTGVPVGPNDVRFSSEADDAGYIYLLGRTNRQVFRYHADTADVAMIDSGGYGTWFFNGLTVKTDGAGRRVALVAAQASTGGSNSIVFTFTLSSPTATHFGPKDTLLIGGGTFIFWDVQFGRNNTLYATFFAKGDSVYKPGVAKFNLASWTGAPLTMADTVWTSRLDSGRTNTAAYWFGANPDGSQDILYFTNARIASGNPPSGQNIYALSNLNAAQPTRAVAYVDLQNNITTIRSDVAVDAVGNIVYFENSNEETVVISPPTGPNNFTTIAHPKIRAIISEPIAAVRIDADSNFIPDRLNDTVTVVGVVNGVNLTASANRFSYSIQDNDAGIVITKSNQPGGGPVYQVGDRLAATGRLGQFNGTAQIDIFGDLATNVLLIDQGNPVVPIDLTIRRRLSNAELYESRLIRINYLVKRSGTWPAASANATLSMGDGVDSVAMFIDLDTDIDGTTEAVYPVNVVGVATQFTSATPPNTGYQISPRFRTDFTENVQAPPNPLFALLSPADGSVLLIDSAASYDFVWRKAVDVNNDPLIYQWKPVAFTGSLSNNAGADTVKTVTGATLLGYLGSADSLVFGWTALTKDPPNPPVSSVDTFVVTLKRTVPPPPLGWTVQTSGTTQALRSVKTLDRFTGWIGGGNGTVLRTTNGGSNWTSVGGGPMAPNIVYAIEAISATTAFATTSPAAGTYIFRTTNGGTSWDTVFSQAGGFLNAIKMFDANNGVAIGDPVDSVWTVVRTTNGGATWTQSPTAPPQAGTETGYNTSFSSVDPMHFWFGTNNSRVYYTTDGGLTWGFGTTSFVSSVGVGFSDLQYGVAGGSGSTGAARTTNGGVTWTTTTLPGTGSIYGVSGKGVDFWAVRGTLVYRSMDRGATWDTSFAGAIGTFRDLDFVWEGNNTYGWAVTSTGGIASFYGLLTGVDDPTENQIPVTFNLDQNFPNPFNPTTTIRYALPKDALVSLKIYNILGQEVLTLRDEMQNVGYHEVVWDGRNVSGQAVASGVYFYRIEAKPADGAEPFTSIKKMLMLK